MINLCPSRGKCPKIAHIIILSGPLFFCSVQWQSSVGRLQRLTGQCPIITPSEGKSKESVVLLHGYCSGCYWESFEKQLSSAVPPSPSPLPVWYLLVVQFLLSSTGWSSGILAWKYDTKVHPFLLTHNILKLRLQIIPVKIADLYDSQGIPYFNLKLSEWFGFVEIMEKCLPLVAFVFKGKSASVLANFNFLRVMRL